MAEPVVVLWDLYQVLRNDRFYQAKLLGKQHGIISLVMAMMGNMLEVNAHTIKCINYSCHYLNGLDCFAAVTVLVHSYESYRSGVSINDMYANVHIPDVWDMRDTRTALETKFKESLVASGSVMCFFRDLWLPLPLELYKNEPDNSQSTIDHLYPGEKERHGSGVQFDMDEVALVVKNLRLGAQQNPVSKEYQAPAEAIKHPPEILIESLRAQGVTERNQIAKSLKDNGIILKEIGRLLRRDGDIDSEEANLKRAQRLLPK